ncbi:hypothetical protein [Thioclava sediminum]|uniref:hypothetical protein n=1 Tax=Thioclava sediminum TaxID=1915319 RepID=UPI0011BAD713|nr:hypothetical protein [Thioclava sediminum]
MTTLEKILMALTILSYFIVCALIASLGVWLVWIADASTEPSFTASLQAVSGAFFLPIWFFGLFIGVVNIIRGNV